MEDVWGHQVCSWYVTSGSANVHWDQTQDKVSDVDWVGTRSNKDAVCQVKEAPATLLQVSLAAHRNTARAAKSWHFFQEQQRFKI